jgi:multidrug efflux pump
MVPLSAIARFSERPTATSVNHQDAELATTVSFNLAEGATCRRPGGGARGAGRDPHADQRARQLPGHGAPAQETNQQQPMLILAAIVVIYIVLGVLYESLVHPITVLSTLPSAGVGAVLALLLFKMEFSIMALIGLFLLIGIVKKNAILIIDFALDAERSRGLSPTKRCARPACCASARS